MLGFYVQYILLVLSPRHIRCRLHKVITVLRRRRDIKIFNFIANTEWAETDLTFAKYASVSMTHELGQSHFIGSSACSGRVDTVFHLRQCLAQSAASVSLPREFDVSLQLVRNVSVGDGEEYVVPLSDHESVARALTYPYSEVEANPEFIDEIKGLLVSIAATNPAQLDAFTFLVCDFWVTLWFAGFRTWAN